VPGIANRAVARWVRKKERQGIVNSQIATNDATTRFYNAQARLFKTQAALLREEIAATKQRTALIKQEIAELEKQPSQVQTVRQRPQVIVVQKPTVKRRAVNPYRISQETLPTDTIEESLFDQIISGRVNARLALKSCKSLGGDVDELKSSLRFFRSNVYTGVEQGLFKGILDDASVEELVIQANRCHW